MSDRPVEYSTATPGELGQERYQRLCRNAGLPPTPGGYGFLHCIADDGEHVTRATEDMAYHETIKQAARAHLLSGLELPPGTYTLRRIGWPDQWMYLGPAAKRWTTDG